MFAIDDSATLPARKAVSRPLSDLASNLRDALATCPVGKAFVVPNVYTDADKTAFRINEGAKRPALSEQAIKCRALGTLAGKMAAQLGYAARAVDRGDGSVNIFKVEKKVEKKAEKTDATTAE